MKLQGLVPDDYPSAYDPLDSYLNLVVDTLENVRPLDTPQITTLPRHTASAAYNKPRKVGALATINYDPDQLERDILKEQEASSSAPPPSAPAPTSVVSPPPPEEIAANGASFAPNRAAQKDREPKPPSDGDFADRRKLDINDPRWRQCLFCGNKNLKEGEVRHDFRYCKYFPAPAMPSSTPCPSCHWFHPTNKPCAPSSSA